MDGTHTCAGSDVGGVGERCVIECCNDEHGGNLRALAEQAGVHARSIIDFSANINPLGFPDFTRAEVGAALADVMHYPDIDYLYLRRALAGFCERQPDEIVPVNGASEAIFLLPRVLKRSQALLLAPGFSAYERACQRAAMQIDFHYLEEARDYALDVGRLRAQISGYVASELVVFLGHPHNPTGGLLPHDEFIALLAQFAGVIFVVDEAFIEFAGTTHSFAAHSAPNVIILRSLTKILAVPGLRLGYVIAARHHCQALSAELPPWNVNELVSRLAQRAVAEPDFFSQSWHATWRLRAALIADLHKLGDHLTVYSSSANFLLIKLTAMTGVELCRRLLNEHHIAVRDLTEMRGLSPYHVRLAVRTDDQQRGLMVALQAVFANTVQKAVLSSAKKRPLMLLGTGSDVGKSILTAALCRIFVQDGLKVAPFKAQNMALNSFVTADGLEIGRAQAVQAQACKIDIDVRMNPILLKPTSDQRSQVIVAGKAIGTMAYRDYIHIKQDLFDKALAAQQSLATEYDLVVMEGAGSASEINLKKHDIVNMAMARAAAAAVILVGDIDRGGVFGSLVGTLETMAEWERELVRGLLINKFRGDKSLLQGGLNYLEQRLGRPVLGVVPHVERINIPDEDSVSFKKSGTHPGLSHELIDIAVIDMPRIANFTDIDPLRLEPDVAVRIVRVGEELGKPDAIILPGSKNVIEDLLVLRDSGMLAQMSAYAAGGGVVVGICGGLQMLGRKIDDPLQIESKCGGCSALGLLALDTVLEREKLLGRTAGYGCSSQHEVIGYEIHHGRSAPYEKLQINLTTKDGRPLGYMNEASNVWGTYLHGVFDSDGFRRHFVDDLRVRRGFAPVGRVLAQNSLDAALDRLAELVRENVDMAAIYRCIDC